MGGLVSILSGQHFHASQQPMCSDGPIPQAHPMDSTNNRIAVKFGFVKSGIGSLKALIGVLTSNANLLFTSTHATLNTLPHTRNYDLKSKNRTGYLLKESHKIKNHTQYGNWSAPPK